MAADRTGKTLAYTRVTFYDAQDRVVAYGSHTKHMGSNQPSIAFSADGETEIPFEPRAKL
jgi:acyl-coenzyme A thioesterase 13